MTGLQALTEMERKLVSVRTIAAQADALEQYQRDTLPAGPIPPLLEQGYAQGWSDAMNAVRRALTELQTQELRKVQVGG